MSFIINPQSASFNLQRNDLIDFLESLPDADKWSVFFASTTGRTLVDLIAAFSAFIKYEAIVARREAFLQSALNRSSNLAGGQNLGYSAYRGRNVIFKINVTPTTSGVWPKYHILGTVKDRDLILLEATTRNAGVPIDVYVVAGVLQEETIQADSNALNIFRFSQKNVSEDLRIFIDVNEVPNSKEIVDLLSGKFVLQSNPFGSVDAKYLNYPSFPSTYTTGTDIKLEWVELKDFLYQLSDVLVDDTEGDLNTVEVDALYIQPETETSIKVNAPLSNETKFVIRAREDQPKILRQLDTTIIDSKGEDISAAIMRLFYLRINDFRFNLTEKNELIAMMLSYRPHGMLPVLIGDPVRLPVTLKVDLYLSGLAGDAINDTKAIIAAYEYKLEGLIDFIAIEQSVEALDSIKIARIEFTGNPWVLNTQYEIGSIVKSTPETTKVFQVVGISYFSDGVEPVWPVVAASTINDGSLIWKAVPKDDTAGIPTWAATTAYQEFNYVKPSVANGFVYQVIGFRRFSDAVEPTWPILDGGTVEDIQGETNYDNEIIWMARAQEGTPAVWSANTNYNVGDRIIATDQSTSDTIGVMFECFGFVGKSGGAQPTFPNVDAQTVLDNNLTWRTLNPRTNPLALAVNQYYKIATTITVN